jgi:hypothetical protein
MWKTLPKGGRSGGAVRHPLVHSKAPFVEDRHAECARGVHGQVARAVAARAVEGSGLSKYIAII